MYAVFQYGDMKDLVTKKGIVALKFGLYMLQMTMTILYKRGHEAGEDEAGQQKFQLYYKSKFIFFHLSGKALFFHFTLKVPSEWAI